MRLLPEYDKQATIKNVRSFFYDDDKYERICRRAGDWGLHSPGMDITGIPGGSAGNSSERKALSHVDYNNAKRAVSFAIRGCTHDSQVILKNRYLPGRKYRMPVYQLVTILHCGRDKYYTLDDQACWDFADTIEAGCEIYHVSSKAIPDFHVKNEKPDDLPTKYRQSADTKPTL